MGINYWRLVEGGSCEFVAAILYKQPGSLYNEKIKGGIEVINFFVD